MSRDFRSLAVWERSHALTLEVYRATATFPDHERFGLVSQMRRASASIPANLAEGRGRTTQPELARFVDIATGSVSEIEYQLLLARDLGYLDEEQHSQLAGETVEIRSMLLAFNKKIRS